MACAFGLLAAGAFTELNAQGLSLPAASPAQTVTQQLGIGQVTLKYARPNVSGRAIFGKLVPFGEVWRTGANQNTTLSFDKEVSIDGKTLPAGTYALFAIPEKNNWTIILNKQNDQWGAYTYDEKQDILRFNVKPQKTPSKKETLEIHFTEVAPQKATLAIEWENTAVSFEMTVNQEKEIMASIQKAMEGPKKPYLAAAQYYYNNDKDLGQALQWADEAIKSNPELPYPYYWKARIQLKRGDKAGARTSAQQGVQAAEKAANSEYIRLNKEVLEKAK